jgi:hypothetical protein
VKKQVFNPYLPSYEYIPDGEPHIFGERLYIYGSHDKFNGEDYCENDYVCWSAPLKDISDWTYEGVIFKKEQDPHKLGENRLFAPDVAKGPDGRFYLYYSVAHSSIMSVAVCDKPAGKYEYYGDVCNSSGEIIGNHEGEYYQFDPGIFVDEDNRIYLYSGFCPRKEKDEYGRLHIGAHVSELEPDMVTIKSGPKVVMHRDMELPEGAAFFEASSMRKIKGTYYFIYSARCTGLHHCFSKYPDRDFVYGGRIHSSSDVGINGHSVENPAYAVGNTHGSIECINGEYYIFDHRFSNNSSYCRQAVAERIEIDSSGKIKQVEATSCGLNGGPLVGKGQYPAYIACNLMDTNEYATSEEKKAAAPYITQEGEDRECEPGQYLKGMKKGCIVGYKYFEFNNTEKISIKVRGKASGTLKVSLKEKDRYISDFAMKLDSNEWVDLLVPFNVSSGVHGLYFQFEGSGYFDMLSFTFD